MAIDDYILEQVTAFSEVIGFCEESLEGMESEKRRENLRKATSRAKDLLIDYLLDRLHEEKFCAQIQEALEQEDDWLPRLGDWLPGLSDN